MKNNEKKYKYHRVLLVDDVELDNFVNEKLLSIHHFAKHISISAGGKQALEILTSSFSGREQATYPEVIFIDINMPLMNGFEFIESLQSLIFKHKLPQPKLVMLTSSVFEVDQQHATDLSSEIIYMIKPLTREMLEIL